MSTTTVLCADKRHYASPQDAHAALRRVSKLRQWQRAATNVYRCECGQWCLGRGR